MKTYLNKGYLDIDNIDVPAAERFEKGAVAIIECVQQIPCNPCVDACSRGAITIAGSINNIPVIDFEKCNGCSICVANCPGLAIFIIDETWTETHALIGMPSEFLPLPEKEEKVTLLDRAGEECGRGKVIKVRNTKAMDRTPIIFIEVEKNLAMIARFFRRDAK